MKILVAMDGSPASMRALDWTVQNMFPENSQPRHELTVLTVVEPVETHFGTHNKEYYEQVARELNEQSKSNAEALLRRISSSLQEKKVPHKCEYIMGSAREAITNYVEEKGMDTVVIGRRGISDTERLVLGSVSDYLVRVVSANIIVIK